MLARTILFLTLLSASVALAQTPNQIQMLTEAQQDIKIVERDYGAFAYGLQLSVLADAARGGKIDEMTIQQPLNDATLSVTVSDTEAGKTMKILNRPLTDFITLPRSGQEAVHVEVLGRDGEPFGSIKAKWGPMEAQPPAEAGGYTVQQFLAKLGDDSVPPKYSHYASFSVALRFQGRSLSYRAMYIFADEGTLQVFPLDPYLAGTRYSQSQAPFRPDWIVRSEWRNIPAMHSWLLAHTVPDDACLGGGLCCVNDRCGLRRSDLDRRMSIPLHSPAPPLSKTGSQEIPGITGVASPEMSAAPLTTCNPDDPEYCACAAGTCATVPPPYPTQPAATCSVNTKYRQLYVLWFPTGGYHTWTTSIVSMHGAAYEVFDAGPQINISPCPNLCGALLAYAKPGNGYLSGDVAGGGGWWNSGGFSADTCSAMVDIQAYTASWGSGIYYHLPGPNSNTFTRTVNNWSGLYPTDPNTRVFAPGWNTRI